MNFYSNRRRFGKHEGYGLYIYPNGDIYDGKFVMLCWDVTEFHGVLW